MSAAAEAKLEDFAEDLGRLLAQAQNKAESWLGQRRAIADHLVGVRDTATRLLAQLGLGEPSIPSRRGRKPGSKNKATAGDAAPAVTRGRPAKKKRTMSAEARARIAAAQRARWARQRKASAKG
jgi:hypothetical protein